MRAAELAARKLGQRDAAGALLAQLKASLTTPQEEEEEEEQQEEEAEEEAAAEAEQPGGAPEAVSAIRIAKVGWGWWGVRVWGEQRNCRHVWPSAFQPHQD